MSVSYYEANAQIYFDSTVAANMVDLRSRFERNIKTGGTILDAGCGSGRDAVAFSKAGFKVVAFDASKEMVRLAQEHTSLSVLHMAFDQMQWVAAFDGIWASASLLHVPRPDLPATFSRFARALKPNGVWYLSMKLGSDTREVDGRTFTDVTKPELQSLLNDAALSVMDCWLSDDVRSGRSDRWINAIAQLI